MTGNNSNEIIAIRNLSKRFENEDIFTNLNLNVEENQIIAILGPSGCGKTTMLRMICGLETCEKDSIFFNGQDIKDNNTEGKVGFINIPKDMIFENLQEYIRLSKTI